MWETLRRAPLGTILKRQFIVFIATILVAVFGYTTLLSSPVSAAPDPGSWDGTNLTYNNHQYSGPTNVKAGDGTGLADGVKYYLFTPSTQGSSQTPPQSYIIFFDSGTDPPTEKEAKLAKVDVNNGKISRVSDVQNISMTPSNGSAQSLNNSANNSQSNSIANAGGTGSCNIDGVGWILCPVSNFLATQMDNLYGIISDFLKVQPLQTTTNNALYRGWEVARNFANICFIIAFLILIYGQISGGLMSNYTIKKVLPRIIVSAILVNISYWICAIGVDISNVLGYAVQDVFTSIRSTLVGSESITLSWKNMEEAVTTGSIAALAGGGAAAGALIVTGGSLIAGIYLLLPALVGVIFSALVAIIVLAMRQALITILVIVAPLAFVAYLLPNTEKWFDRWRDLFMNMLLLFPIFSVVFGGSQLAGSAIIAGSGGNLTIIILGMVVQVAPVVITPLIVKFGGSLIGRVAGVMNNRSKGVVDRTRNFANSRAELHKNRSLARGNDQTKVRAFGRDFNVGKANLARRSAQALYRGQKKRESWNEGYQKEADNLVHAHHPNTNPSRVPGITAYRNRRAANSFHAAEVYKERAEIRHQQLHAHHSEEFYEGIQNADDAEYARNNPKDAETRRQMLATHKSKGITELYQGAITGAGENALRSTIANNDGLRNIVIQTTQNQKQAAEYQTIVQKAADEAYDNFSRTNTAAQELRLRSVVATESAANAEKQMNLVIENARAKGYEATSVADANSLIADQLQTLTIQGTVQDSAIDSAKRVAQQNVADALKRDTDLQIQAAGVGGDAAIARVIASAKSTVSGALTQDIDNIESTLDYDIAKSPKRLRTEFDATNDIAKKIAVARAMSKNGGPGMSELRKLLGDYGNDPNTSTGDLDAFKEILAADSSIRSAGKDIEFYLSKAFYQDREGNATDPNGIILPPGATPVYKSFDEIKNDIGTWTNLSATAFAAQSPSTQRYALRRLSQENPEKYQSVIDNIRTNPAAQTNIKQGIVEEFSIYSPMQYQAADREGRTLPEPGTHATDDLTGLY